MAEQPPDPLRQFVIAAHFSLDGVKEGLRNNPDWLNVVYDWGPEGGKETPLGPAAHVGNRAIAEYLLSQGAPLTPTAAAMLGREDDLRAFLDRDPADANATGAHGIPMLAHVAFSGDVALAELLKARGNTGAGVSMGLIHAAGAGHTGMAAWMLDNGADPSAKNFQGKTALELAREAGHAEIVTLIEQRQG